MEASGREPWEGLVSFLSVKVWDRPQLLLISLSNPEGLIEQLLTCSVPVLPVTCTYFPLYF